jgi:hypothetical protein
MHQIAKINTYSRGVDSHSPTCQMRVEFRISEQIYIYIYIHSPVWRRILLLSLTLSYIFGQLFSDLASKNTKLPASMASALKNWSTPLMYMSKLLLCKCTFHASMSRVKAFVGVLAETIGTSRGQPSQADILLNAPDIVQIYRHTCNPLHNDSQCWYTSNPFAVTHCVGLRSVNNPKRNYRYAYINWPCTCAVITPIDQNQLLTQYFDITMLFH